MRYSFPEAVEISVYNYIAYGEKQVQTKNIYLTYFVNFSKSRFFFR